ncbi:MAG: carbamoyltransferase [Candidatus Hodarchaeota archaeon]
MKILGIADGMTAGVALIENGRIIFAAHEERLIREKMATGFPRQSISKVFEVTHTKPEEVDAVAVATINEFFADPAVGYDGWLLREQTPFKEVILNISSTMSPILGGWPLFKQSYYNIKSLLTRRRRKEIAHLLRRDWELECPIRFIDHHYAHACSAYFTSGLVEATVITMDGAGDHSSSHIYVVKDGHFQKLWNLDSFDSIGNYYAYITHICGFKAQKHEGKITGLAAYGQPIYTDILKQFTAYDKGSIRNTGKVYYWSAVRAIERALPKPFKREDLASSMQEILEEEVCAYAQYWTEKTRCGDLALAGGVFANVKLNQRIHELENVRSIFIHPGMGDEGLAVGAALGLYYEMAPSPQAISGGYRLKNVYFGPCYSDNEIKAEIDAAGLEAEYINDIEVRIAKLLSEGFVVGRFDGGMEYGPRALGNRSILYQATDPTVNDWLNKNLKRTEFMPFAPVTLKEFEDQCYENMDGARYPAKFMTITFDCTPWMKKTCPAVVHVDGSARPQIIEREVNPSYYKIVDEYRKITGLPTIINTSFNMHEEPIVCTPFDSIRSFKMGHLDYLAIGHFLLKNT